VAVRSRFTRIPKVHDLILAGVPTEVIPTYAALADYSGNRTGLAWPRMESLARRLRRSPRTIQRHVKLLTELGLVEIVERTRDRRGRFGAYVYRLVHIVAATARGRTSRSERRARGRGGSTKRPTTGHEGRVASNKGKTKRHEGPPLPPKKDPKDGYWSFFGEEPSPAIQEQHQKQTKERRLEEANRRRRGFEWLFE
jgi:DNA-binding transcriptional ArsR family regulator